MAMREERATLLLEGKPLPPHLTGATLDSPCASPTHSLEEGGGSGDGAVGGNAKKSSSGSRKRYSDFLTDEDSMDEEETNLAMLKGKLISRTLEREVNRVKGPFLDCFQ